MKFRKSWYPQSTPHGQKDCPLARPSSARHPLTLQSTNSRLLCDLHIMHSMQQSRLNKTFSQPIPGGVITFSADSTASVPGLANSLVAEVDDDGCALGHYLQLWRRSTPLCYVKSSRKLLIGLSCSFRTCQNWFVATLSRSPPYTCSCTWSLGHICDILTRQHFDIPPLTALLWSLRQSWHYL